MPAFRCEFFPEYSCRDVDAAVEIVLRLAGSNDRAREREVHFRPDRNDLQTGGREEEKDEEEKGIGR